MLHDEKDKDALKIEKSSSWNIHQVRISDVL